MHELKPFMVIISYLIHYLVLHTAQVVYHYPGQLASRNIVSTLHTTGGLN